MTYLEFTDFRIFRYHMRLYSLKDTSYILISIAAEVRQIVQLKFRLDGFAPLYQVRMPCVYMNRGVLQLLNDGRVGPKD